MSISESPSDVPSFPENLLGISSDEFNSLYHGKKLELVEALKLKAEFPSDTIKFGGRILSKMELEDKYTLLLEIYDCQMGNFVNEDINGRKIYLLEDRNFVRKTYGILNSDGSWVVPPEGEGNLQYIQDVDVNGRRECIFISSEENNSSYFLNKDGSWVTPPENIGKIIKAYTADTNGRILCQFGNNSKERKSYRMLNSDGSWVIPPEGLKRISFAYSIGKDGRFVCEFADEKTYGILNSDSSWVIPPEGVGRISNIYGTSNNGEQVCEFDDGKSCGVLKSDGSWEFTTLPEGVNKISIMPRTWNTNRGILCQFDDKESFGTLGVNNVWSFATLPEGLGSLKSVSSVFLNGDVVHCFSCSGGLAILNEDGSWLKYSGEIKRILGDNDEQISVCELEDGSYGILNSDGSWSLITLPKPFSSIQYIEDPDKNGRRLCLLDNNGSYGLLKSDGSWVVLPVGMSNLTCINPAYYKWKTPVYMFNEGESYGVLNSDDSWTLVPSPKVSAGKIKRVRNQDKNGRRICEFNFNDGPFCLLNNDNSWVSVNGENIFEDITYTDRGYLITSLDGTTRLIKFDESTETLIQEGRDKIDSIIG